MTSKDFTKVVVFSEVKEYINTRTKYCSQYLPEYFIYGMLTDKIKCQRRDITSDIMTYMPAARERFYQ